LLVQTVRTVRRQMKFEGRDQFNNNHIVGSPVSAPEELYVYRRSSPQSPRSGGATCRVFLAHCAPLERYESGELQGYRHSAPLEQGQVSQVCHAVLTVWVLNQGLPIKRLYLTESRAIIRPKVRVSADSLVSLAKRKPGVTHSTNLMLKRLCDFSSPRNTDRTFPAYVNNRPQQSSCNCQSSELTYRAHFEFQREIIQGGIGLSLAL